MRHRRNVRARNIELLDAKELLLLGAHRLAPGLHDIGDHQHIGTVGFKLEPLADIFAQHRGRERPEGFAELDLEIEHRLHCRRPRVAKDRAVAQSARAEFHPPLMPADSLALGERISSARQQARLIDDIEFGAGAAQPVLDIALRIAWPQIGAVHGIARGSHLAGSAADAMIGRQSCAQSPSGIAGRRLHPDIGECSIAQDFAVRHAIQRNAASKAEIGNAGFRSDRAGEGQHDLLEDELDRRRDVHFALGEELVGPARRPPEQFVEPAVGHGQAGAVIEIIEIEAERAVGFHIDQIVTNKLGIARLTIRGEAHELVFA